MSNPQLGIVSEDEYESVKVIASRIAKSYDAIMSSEKAQTESATILNESILALIPVLQSIAEMKHEIIVQPSGVTVEAAKVMMPEMPAPVVHVMEAEEHMMSYRFTFERDGRGFITGGTITPL